MGSEVDSSTGTPPLGGESISGLRIHFELASSPLRVFQCAGLRGGTCAKLQVLAGVESRNEIQAYFGRLQLGDWVPRELDGPLSGRS